MFKKLFKITTILILFSQASLIMLAVVAKPITPFVTRCDNTVKVIFIVSPLTLCSLLRHSKNDAISRAEQR